MLCNFSRLMLAAVSIEPALKMCYRDLREKLKMEVGCHSEELSFRINPCILGINASVKKNKNGKHQWCYYCGNNAHHVLIIKLKNAVR